MRIIIDQDEVLAEFVEGILEKWNSQSGDSYTRDDVKSWDLSALFGAEAEGWVRRTISHHRFFADLAPKPGAIDGFKWLVERGHDLLIVTHVDPNVTNAFEGKREWCRRWLPDFKLKNLSFHTRKELIDADMLVDDGPHNIRGWLEAGRPGATVFDAPWNRDQDLMWSTFPSRLDRVLNWEDLVAKMAGQEQVKEALSEGAEARRRAHQATHGIHRPGGYWFPLKGSGE